VIEDLDGADHFPSRARALTAISVVLALGAIAAYGAMSSPFMRGPYATPDPSGGPARELLSKARYTTAPFASIEPAEFIGRTGPVEWVALGGSSPQLCTTAILRAYSWTTYTADTRIRVIEPVVGGPVVAPNGRSAVWIRCDPIALDGVVFERVAP
jgi:hypothetical protein